MVKTLLTGEPEGEGGLCQKGWDSAASGGSACYLRVGALEGSLCLATGLGTVWQGVLSRVCVPNSSWGHQ